MKLELIQIISLYPIYLYSRWDYILLEGMFMEGFIYFEHSYSSLGSHFQIIEINLN